MLDQHRDVFWDGEVLELLLHNLARRRGCGIDSLAGKLTPSMALAAIRRRFRRRKGTGLYGLELQPYQLELFGLGLRTVLNELRGLGFTRFVILDRENQLQKLASHVLAQHRGMHHTALGVSGVEQIAIRPQRVYLGHRFRTLADALRLYDSFLSDARELLVGEEPLMLDYDAHISADPLVAYRLLCAHLGLEAEAPGIKYRKTAPVSFRDLVSNADEVLAYVEQEGFDPVTGRRVPLSGHPPLPAAA
jgi:hypothetical protein